MVGSKSFLIAAWLLPISLGSALAQTTIETGTTSFRGVAVTTFQTAVFAEFLSDMPQAELPDIQTGISVSNVVASFFPMPSGPASGSLEFYLYNRDGSLILFETDMDPSVGIGVDEAGILGPGQTYTVLLRDIITSALGEPVPFHGTGWIVANFVGVAGTYSVFIAENGFLQSFEMLPGVGQNGLEAIGIPLEPPPPPTPPGARILQDCDPASPVLQVLEGTGCFPIAAPDPSYILLDTPLTVAVLYLTPDCTGDQLVTVTMDASFCGLSYPGGAGLNDNVRSVAIQELLSVRSP